MTYYCIKKMYAPLLLSGTRQICTSQVNNRSRSIMKLKKLQADYQCEDGKPVWLKGGMKDRILYTSTIVLCYVGTFMTFEFLYDQIKPTSWRQKTC